MTALRATPENSEETKTSILRDLAELEIVAKTNAVEYWETRIEDKYKQAKKLPNNAEQALDVLDSVKKKTTSMTFEEIQTRLSAFVFPVVGTPARSSSEARPGGAGDNDESGSGDERRADRSRHAKGRQGDRQVKCPIAATDLVFRDQISNARTGYNPSTFHVHVNGNAQDNMIYDANRRFLGFVDGHIARDTKNKQTEAYNVEYRATDNEWVEIGVFNGNVYEIT